MLQVCYTDFSSYVYYGTISVNVLCKRTMSDRKPVCFINLRNESETGFCNRYICYMETSQFATQMKSKIIHSYRAVIKLKTALCESWED